MLKKIKNVVNQTFQVFPELVEIVEISMYFILIQCINFTTYVSMAKCMWKEDEASHITIKYLGILFLAWIKKLL